MARQLTIDIVPNKLKIRRSWPISKDWDYVYIPMTEEEILRYALEGDENPCWRIGVQPKEFVR